MFGWNALTIVPVKNVDVMLPEIVPVTVRLASVPISVINGWLAVLIEPYKLVALTLTADTLAVASTLPVTLRSVRVPTFVMFVCVASRMTPRTFVNVPVAPDTLPVVTLPAICATLKLALVTFKSLTVAPLAVMFAVVTAPVTVSVASVPMLVILVCAESSIVPRMFVNVPVAPDTLPVVTLPTINAVDPILA